MPIPRADAGEARAARLRGHEALSKGEFDFLAHHQMVFLLVVLLLDPACEWRPLEKVRIFTKTLRLDAGLNFVENYSHPLWRHLLLLPTA